MVNMPKPYPDIYLKVINSHNLNKEETIVIEDSVVGIQAAKAAEIKVIGLTAGSNWHSDSSEWELIASGAFKVINDYKSLDKILKII